MILHMYCAWDATVYSRVQNKEWTVHGQMAKYFNKCLAIYKSV